MGICLSNIKTPLDDSINWQNTGHGCYLFEATGRVFSHSDATVNDKSKSFEYSKGDTVEMSYDPARGKLRASKGSEQYELSVPAGDYRICVVLLLEGDSVTVE